MGEARRGCGYRKIGGTYMVGGRLSRPCGRLPYPLHVCPTCSQGIKQTRGWTWVQPAKLLATLKPCAAPLEMCMSCPMNDPAKLGDKDGRAGLLWIGEGFYKTVDEFALEADKMGVCRRITAIPKGLKLGETWVLLAHPKACREGINGEAKLAPGVFAIFKPTAIERIVTEEEFKDTAAMEKLREQGLTPVPVPDEPKHRGTVYDKEDEPQLNLEGGE